MTLYFCFGCAAVSKEHTLEMSIDSGIEDYSVRSSSSTNKKNVQMLMTIPGAMMLDHMLMQLGFPAAEYRHKLHGDNKTGVTVIFNTSKVPPHGYIRYQENGSRRRSTHSCCTSYKVPGKCS